MRNKQLIQQQYNGIHFLDFLSPYAFPSGHYPTKPHLIHQYISMLKILTLEHTQLLKFTTTTNHTHTTYMFINEKHNFDNVKMHKKNKLSRYSAKVFFRNNNTYNKERVQLCSYRQGRRSEWINTRQQVLRHTQENIVLR